MIFEQGALNQEQKLNIEINLNKKLFKSNLKSLDGIGVAPSGELTTVIGPRGNGKSAFVKTVLSEACSQNVKTLVILSEETTLAYKKPICDIINGRFKTIEASNKLNNIYYTSMLNWTENLKNIDCAMFSIEKIVREQNIEFIVFDNFTTSFFGRVNISEQGRAIEKFRNFANKLDISLLVVFHTQKGANPYVKLLDGDDVRGNATSTNTAANNYVLTTFFKCVPPRSFLHIDKARYNPGFNKTYWELRFNNEAGIYVEDIRRDPSFIEALQSELRKQHKNIKPYRAWMGEK